MDQPSRTVDYKSRGHLSDAGVVGGRLSIERDESQAELQRQYERKSNGWSGRNILTVLIVTFAARAINDLGWLPLLQAYMAAYGAAAVVEYWVPPRPPQSFVSWVLKIVGVWVNLYVGLVTVPESLRDSLPTSLAYGLPAFVVLLIFYWVPPLYPVKRRDGLWKWALMAAVFAVFWGWSGPHV